MGVLLLVGGGEGRCLELSGEVERLSLSPVQVGGYGEALSFLETRPVAVVVVDGWQEPPDGWPSLSGLVRECASRRVPLLYLGSTEDTQLGFWDTVTPGLFDILFLPLDLPLLRMRLAILLEMKALRMELDRKTLELEVLHQELAELSSLDQETGLFGRHYFIDHFTKEWRQAERSSAPLVLLRVEIDGFAEYLERQGREKGLARLGAVAQALYSCLLRPNDLLARYAEGGFAILLPETEADGGHEVARRLRRAVAELSIAGGDDMVSLSIGCAQRLSVAGGKVVESGESFLQLAEESLERALAEGGDRMVIGTTTSVAVGNGPSPG